MAVKRSTETEKSFSALAGKFLWADDAGSVDRAIKYLAILCVILFVADFLIHRHSYFSIEGWYGFYPFAGFVAFTLIVLGAKTLRKLILRPEDYYGQSAIDSEEYPAEGLERLEHTDMTEPGHSASNRVESTQQGDAARD